MTSLSIKARLRFSLLFITLVLAAVWYTNGHFQQRILFHVEMRDQLEQLHATLLALRQEEKDFIAHHDAAELDRFRADYARFQEQAGALTRDLSSAGLDVAALQEVSAGLSEYRKAFLDVFMRQQEIGLDYSEGEYAALRDSAGAVEQVVADDPELLAGLLRLRGFEKDFMLSRDPAYATRFATAISDFRGLLFMSELDNALKADIQSALASYYDHFQILVQREIDIGLDSGSGLLGSMHTLINGVEAAFERVRLDLDEKLSASITGSRSTSSVLTLAGLALVLLMLAHTSRSIRASLGSARRSAQRLGEGRWQEPVKVAREDEVGQVLSALEMMRRQLLESTGRLAAEADRKDRHAALAGLIQGIKDCQSLAEDVTRHLTPALDCQVGAFYLLDGETLRCLAGYGLARESMHDSIPVGEGLAGQAARDRRPIIVRNVPAGYLPVTSGTGAATPASVMVVPLEWNGTLFGILEVGSLRQLDEGELEFACLAAETIAIGLHAALAREETARLLEQARNQARDLEAQQDAMREANERLEKQAAALQRSESTLQVQQEELQAQQEELRVTNEELEAQSRLLQERSRELERRNREMEQMLARREAG